MSKVTIASAVLAGVSIADRLSELEVPYDEVLFTGVGDLAENLAKVMATLELIDECVKLAVGDIQAGNVEHGVKGLQLIAGVTTELLADQDKIEQAMGITPEEKALYELLAALGVKLG
ncbi:hypothetical protein [Pseudomonas phage COT4]|uniref:Uncharacterized protein n=1 Tax=Pseudomonas phage M5.1 TaxID=2873460 RepID=A0AAE8XEK9_9CAUD|nr:hypothetical protein QGX13_gp132 [Pseudomonas phage M5.1]UAV89692.1 hypothetical protein M51_110 [Pseudomonas phage M5.1]UGL61292.1 hypothetical protein [Pseudomonas phage COT4]